MKIAAASYELPAGSLSVRWSQDGDVKVNYPPEVESKPTLSNGCLVHEAQSFDRNNHWG